MASRQTPKRRETRITGGRLAPVEFKEYIARRRMAAPTTVEMVTFFNPSLFARNGAVNAPIAHP